MRKGLVATAIVLVVLLGAAWLGDNYVRGVAEDRAARTIQSQLALSQKPDVSLQGFPFSLAFVTRTVPGARASALSVPFTVSGKAVQLTGVRAETGAITLVGNTVHVARADATGVLDYGDLAQLAGVPISYAGDGRIELVYATKVSGIEVTLGVTALPVLDAAGGAIRLTKVKIDPKQAPSVPLPAADLPRLARPIPVSLPGGARLTALTPADGGIAVAASISDVSFALR